MIFFIPISIAAIEICFAFTLVIFLLKKVMQPDFRIFKNSAFVYLAIFLFFCALSINNSGIYFLKGLRAIFGKWLENILIFIVIIDTLNSSKKIKRALLVLLITATLICVDSIYLQIVKTDFIRHKTNLGAATFNTQNSCATYLSPILLFLIVSLFKQKRRLISRIVYILLLILFCAAYILTFSRGSWLGFIAALFFLGFLSRNFKQPVILVLIFIAILLLVPIARQKILFSFAPGGDNFRFAITNVSWAVIDENPFLGKGIGTYMLYFKRHAPPDLGVQYAHNCYLQIWAECGIFALLAFILFSAAVLGRAIRYYKKGHDFRLLSLICGIFGFLVHSLFDNQLYSLQLAIYFWLLLGLLVSMTRIEEAKQVAV
jgi:O-antigen ligase